MIAFVPFEKRHLDELHTQEKQRWISDYFTPQQLIVMEDGWSNTIVKDGHPVLCGGVLEIWPNRAVMWAVIGDNMTPQEFLQAHYLSKSFVDALPHIRIEMYVECDFLNAHRWAKALGFHMECERMGKFQVNGKDCAMYARIKR